MRERDREVRTLRSFDVWPKGDDDVGDQGDGEFYFTHFVANNAIQKWNMSVDYPVYTITTHIHTNM